MATQQYRIVSAEESEIHDEPHIEGSRITVRDVHARAEQRGLALGRVAERYNFDDATLSVEQVADVIHAVSQNYPQEELQGLEYVGEERL